MRDASEDPEPMKVGLLRHGVAEDAGPRTHWSDEPRELTEEGRRRMTAAARGIDRLALGFEVLLTSPLPRCAQTAAIIGGHLALEPRLDDRLRPGFDAERAVFWLMEHALDSSILICGHQPDLSFFVAELTGGGSVAFKKGALAIIDLDAPMAGAGVLSALYPPAALRALGGA